VGCENRRREVNLSGYREKERFVMKLRDQKGVESRSIYVVIETSWELFSWIINWKEEAKCCKKNNI